MTARGAVSPAMREAVVRFHGHVCPGLALGMRAAAVALEEIGSHSMDEEVVAFVESDMCGVDAIQVLTGCTFGKGNLIHRDHGKDVYTFFRRSDGRAIRVSKRTGAPESVRPGGPEAPDEDVRSGPSVDGWVDAILTCPIEEMYEVREVSVEVPARTRYYRPLACDSCGEPTMETRIRLFDGGRFCPPCFELASAGRMAVPLGRRP
ncbi:MAG: FmdE family protein [Actinomycetota bacterium]